MSIRALRVALLLASLPVTGCGTVANLAKQKPGEDGVSPFGGVKQDVWCIQKASSGEFGLRAHPKSETEKYPRVALMILCAADLPLSLIGDVVTWPYTVSYTCINQPIPTPPVLIDQSPELPAIPTPPATSPMPIPILPPTLPNPDELPKMSQ